MGMKELGQRIKDTRLEKGKTLDEVASYVGVAVSTIQRYEAGNIQRMKLPVIESIANALGVNPAWLIGKDDKKTPMVPTRSFPNVLEIGKQRFPLFSGIACGEPIVMDDDIEAYVAVTTNIKADFVLRAVGDSMALGIMDGDLVFIRSQPVVENGEVAAVAIGDSATLKRFYRYPDSKTIILRPDNPIYKEMVYHEDSLDGVRVMGKAVAFQRDVR